MKRVSIVFSVVILVLCSCTDKSIVLEDNIIFNGKSWERDKTAAFDFEVKDTSKTYELYYIIRNMHAYAYCNLYLKYNLKNSEDVIVSHDFQDILLYNPKTGEPYGKSEMLNEAQKGVYLFKSIKFKDLGMHKFSVTHQMRDMESLEGIESIGVQVKILE